MEGFVDEPLVAPGATSITRFAPGVQPEDPALVRAIEAALPARV